MSFSTINHPKRKLDPHDIYLIKRLRHEGLRLHQIAEKFEISVSHVSNICKNKAWVNWTVDRQAEV